MSKVVKRMMIDEIRDRLGEARELVIIDSSRLDASSDNQLRLGLREKGITVMQVKNTLARKAMEELGVAGDDIRPLLSGPSSLVWGGEDIVALSKEIAQWAKQIDQLEIKGGAVEGQAIDAEGIDQLSKSPGRLELIGQIAGLALSPGARLAGALLGPGGTISGQLEAIAEKEEEAA
ncbi:50S ribosomal protein L10 [Maioricimonas rarisocia]|uniref:Large ribosomal subunit protein uL10 n=1 Tax=Maioricimonas rarisocia TaxID=2528026 RepID=A0A517ZBG2_9PLAN|nr:50S ribosomal protein L10 [Maioricimonas rarisocia]QDU39833.1 50S ribosomal protein L10 [Maioricimonas rarisocia]